MYRVWLALQSAMEAMLEVSARILRVCTHPLVRYGLYVWGIFVLMMMARAVFHMGFNLVLLTILLLNGYLWYRVIGPLALAVQSASMIAFSFAIMDSFFWGSTPLRSADQFIGLFSGLALQGYALRRIHRVIEEQKRSRNVPASSATTTLH